jgi:hypothetical protein
VRAPGPRTDRAKQSKEYERRDRPTGTSIDGGETRTTESGNTAPVAKVPTDVRAASTERAVVTSEMPSSSRA